MEKFIQKDSGINKIIGTKDKKQESELIDVFSRKIKDTQTKTKEFESVELKKSPETQKLISDIIKNLDEFLLRYGVKAVNVSPDNILMLDYAKLTEDQKQEIKKENNQGAYYIWRQKIIANIDATKESPATLTEIVAHELIHLNSFQSLQKIPSEKGAEAVFERKISKETAYLKRRRLGFSIKDKENNELGLFLDEAITSELTSRFCDFFFSKNESLKKVAEKKQEFIKNLPVEKQELAQKNILEIKTTRQESGDYKSEIAEYSYPKWREALNIIIDELFEKNKDKFSSKEEVFNLFADAHFKGTLLPLARLLEKTFSKGIFRYFLEISKKPKN